MSGGEKIGEPRRVALPGRTGTIPTLTLQHTVSEPADPQAPAPPNQRTPAPEAPPSPHQSPIEPPNLRATGHLQDSDRVSTPPTGPAALRALRVLPRRRRKAFPLQTLDSIRPILTSPNLPLRARRAERGSTRLPDRLDRRTAHDPKPPLASRPILMASQRPAVPSRSRESFRAEPRASASAPSPATTKPFRAVSIGGGFAG
jgi:hypothetical protein